MSVKSVIYNRQTTTQLDTVWSPAIWANCPILAIQEGELRGTVWQRDFDTLPKTPATTEGNFGEFAQYGAADATITVATNQGSGWKLSGATQGDQVGFRSRSTPWIIDRTNGGRFWFEARVKKSTIADTNVAFFLGLMDDTALASGVPLASATALATAPNFVGFLAPGNARSTAGTGGAIASAVYQAGGVTPVTVKGDAVTFVADTWTKLGMYFEPAVDPFTADTGYTGAAKYNVYWYQDGLRTGAVKQVPTAQGTDFPNNAQLGFVLSHWVAAASSFGSVSISNVRIAQLFPQPAAGA
jgi:hypothetical protein